MVRLLKKKYGEGPKTTPKPKTEKKEEPKSRASHSSGLSVVFGVD